MFGVRDKRNIKCRLFSVFNLPLMVIINSLMRYFYGCFDYMPLPYNKDGEITSVCFYI